MIWCITDFLHLLVISCMVHDNSKGSNLATEHRGLDEWEGSDNGIDSQ